MPELKELFYSSESPTSKAHVTTNEPRRLFSSLSVLDRLLAPLVLVFMIAGCSAGALTGDTFPNAFDQTQFNGVSLPISIGLLIMMWPVLTKVQWEELPSIFRNSQIWWHIGISLFLNWIIGPFLMLGLAWATLPDLTEYRIGIILVGIARCIAMVMIWNQLAKGDQEFCAVLVVVNSILQIALFAPVATLFINIISRESEFKVAYEAVAVDVSIYLGIPLAAGLVTRYAIWFIFSKHFLTDKFLPIFGPVALIGLLYTIFVLFAYQGNGIVNNIGSVFRTTVPLVLYFTIMWSSAFALIYLLSRRNSRHFNYETACVQSFTAGSNNFELAIAVAIAVYGVGSKQALAATIGPLIEVPVLISLTWVALWLRMRLNWCKEPGFNFHR